VAGLNIFFIVHAVLHGLFWRHPDYHFKTLFSWLWILGAALCGAVDLWMYSFA
jgi:hypothetical protein